MFGTLYTRLTMACYFAFVLPVESSISRLAKLALPLLFVLFSVTASAQAVGIKVGQLAPDFTVVNLKGEPVSLSDFRGTPLVLNFWATWCPPCREEMPLFQRAYDELQDAETPLGAFLVNLSEQPSDVQAFLESSAITLPVGLDATKEMTGLPDTVVPTASVFQVYRAVGLPTTYFIDAEGIVRNKKMGQVAERELSALLISIGVAWSP